MRDDSRWIVHADMDAFYASIEQRDNPELRGRPVVVGATTPRGVVAAASYEARQHGIHSAMPGFQAHKLCPQATFLPGRHGHYSAVSAKVQEVFRRYTPKVEPLALDEAFLDVTGCSHLFGGVESLARRVQQDVWDATQLHVSVGIAPNKLVAKIACAQGKPKGLVLVQAEQVKDYLAPLAVGKMWGVGPVLEKRLRGLGIQTLGDLERFEPDELCRQVGRRAPELQRLARGQDDRPVVVDRIVKSIGEENTFEQDVTSQEKIFDVLVVHADSVARRLRRGGLRGRTVTLKIRPVGEAPRRAPDARGAHHATLTRSKSLREPIDDAQSIARVARALWTAAGIESPVRLLGVTVSGLESIERSTPQQLDLFGSLSVGGSPPRAPIGPTLDAIEERFGAGVIRRAVSEVPLKGLSKNIAPAPRPREEPEK